MIEEFFNLVLALTTVAITLLDPVMQMANGVDMYMEASYSEPIFVTCPPRVAAGSWTCSDRRPLPECYLFCPTGFVSATEDRVDCETYRDDNTTNFACVPAAALILGGLDGEDRPVNVTEIFTSRNGFLQPLNLNNSSTSETALETQKALHLMKTATTSSTNRTQFQSPGKKKILSTVISATSEWYNGRLLTCGGTYRRSCSSLLVPESEFEPHSVLNNWHEGASSNVLGPILQLRGSIGNSVTEVFSDEEGWVVGARLSEAGNQTCTAQINSTHVAVSGMSETDLDGWLIILTSEKEVARVNMTGAGGGRWAHGCVAYEDKVLIAGGFKWQPSDHYIETLSSTAILDLPTLQWRVVNSMDRSRAAFSRLVVMDNYAWVFGGINATHSADSSIERFHLQTETWETLDEQLSVERGGHTVSSIPVQQWRADMDPTEEDNSTYIHPEFQSPVVEALDKYHAIATMVLIYVPTLYVCISNLMRSLGKRNNRGIVVRSISTIIIPFPIIQTLISFVAFKLFPRNWLQMVKPQNSEMEDLDVQKMKAEVQMAGTFYNSCPSICLQVLIIITFPDRTISWLQIGSVCISTVTTIWTAANLYQLQLQEEIDTKEKRSTCEKLGNFCTNLGSKLKSLVLAIPLLLSSMVFNFTNIILGIINNNYFILFYILAAFLSLLLPATFSPAASIAQLEKVLRIGRDEEKSKEDRKGIKKLSQVTKPPTTVRELMKNLSRGINMAYVNIFCIARPICNASPAVRHYMVGLYPLHFVVNMTTLLFEKYFGTTNVVTISGIIFNINTIIWIAIGAGLVNLILFILFYYPDIFVVMGRCFILFKISPITCCPTLHHAFSRCLCGKSKSERNTSYKLSSSIARIDKEVKQESRSRFKPHLLTFNSF